MDGDAFDVFIDAHQRKAQLGLARIAFGIKGDERSTDTPAEERRGA